MAHYTLYDLEKLTGILADTIRIWERRYNILIAKRTGTNRRWYDDDDLRRLINISVLYNSGIKISKIAKFSESEITEKVEFLTKSSSSTDKQINSLIISMISYDSQAVNEIILRSILNIGFEETFTSVIFPFLKRVGIMWHTGSANIGSEHFMTNIFRGRLIAAIESLAPVKEERSKRVIMFLPDNEFHELGLLFYSYLIRKMGHEVLYLGQATPFFALAEVKEKWHSDIIFTGTSSDLSILDKGEYLNNLRTAFKSQKILVSGSLADAPGIDKFHNIYPVRSAGDLKKYL